ncbi:hypothetical protein INT43_003874 [Umbelopsis isabellina]|uniref:Flavin reductase like domain-containing protein n=1 Tax=Mortierella isabellina TaxID=91625 RepID=A0A8H7PU12_MORIS|nr:hypothetical protein INT43_003874 [Umbelopsis isabellina]
MRKVPQPVVVVTTARPENPEYRRGITVSSFTSIALHPFPLISFCVRKPSRASDLLHEAGQFVVQVLSSHQVQQSLAFSSPNQEGVDQFKDVPFYSDPQTHNPVLMGSVGAMHCSTHNVFVLGDHELWVAKVDRVDHGVGSMRGTRDESEPLLYHDRRYHGVGEEVFMQAFEDHTLDFRQWTHRAHVRMAWNYLREMNQEEATPLIKHGIESYYKANKDKIQFVYNETITGFYIDLIHKAVQKDKLSGRSEDDDFFEFLERYPILKDRKVIKDYYSRELLDSDDSRQQFIEPDLQPLPTVQQLANESK